MSALRQGSRTSLAALLVWLIGIATGGAYAALSSSKASGPAKPEITAAPQKLTNHPYAAFGYSSKPPVGFLCSLDAVAFTVCGSGTHGSISYAGPLADGQHTFRVRAQFGAAIGKTVQKTWTIDTQAPPAPVFTRKPPESTTATSARFRFADAENETSWGWYTTRSICVPRPVVFDALQRSMVMVWNESWQEAA